MMAPPKAFDPWCWKARKKAGVKEQFYLFQAPISEYVEHGDVLVQKDLPNPDWHFIRRGGSFPGQFGGRGEVADDSAGGLKRVASKSPTSEEDGGKPPMKKPK